jgi:hypothetical protein
MRFRSLPAVVAVVFVTTSGLVHGLWSGRWSDGDILREATARLTLIPLIASEWEGRDLPMNPRQLKNAEVSGALQRHYVNRRSGSVVALTLLCGRPGPISVHTPDICYRSSGYEEVGQAARYSSPENPGIDLWIRRFQKQTAIPTQLRIFYGWTTNGVIEAPHSPRLTFAGRPVLYKLYLVRELLKANESIDSDPALDLLRVLRPQLRTTLTDFPPDPS